MLSGPIREEAFDTTTIHHAEQLRKLEFTGLPMEGGRNVHVRHAFADQFVLSRVRAEQLSRRCFQLKELRLRVSRMQGGEGEVAVYRHLGKMPRLARLIITLHCSVEFFWRPGMNYGPEYDENGEPIYFLSGSGIHGGVRHLYCRTHSKRGHGFVPGAGHLPSAELKQ